MLLATKGYTKFQIEVSDPIRIVTIDAPPELRTTSLAIANSLKALMRYHIKNSKNGDKEQVVIQHLQDLGWHVQQVFSPSY